MKIGETIIYKGYGIYKNKYSEYCVLSDVGGNQMINPNASFKTQKEAEIFIDNIFK